MCGQKKGKKKKKTTTTTDNYYRANLLMPTSVNAATQAQTVELAAINFKLTVI